MLLALGCNRVGSGAATDGGEASGTSGGGTTHAETDSGSGTSGSSGGTSTEDGSEVGETTPSPDMPPACELCGNKVYGCMDGVDNDNDGQVDMADLDCISPCDDDEAALPQGLPQFDWDCRLDCFVDANYGQGDDDCDWDLTCDPLAGADVDCAYDPQQKACPEQQEPGCAENCLPSIPPGCDCFGCCEVDTPGGKRTVHVAVPDDDCSLENLDACDECELNLDCFKACPAESCVWCFGEDAPPEQCDEPECLDNAVQCEVDAQGQTDDCPPCHHCLYGCCVPTPAY